MTPQRWSKNDFLAAWNTESTVAEVAARLGRTPADVYKRRKRLGLPAKPRVRPLPRAQQASAASSGNPTPHQALRGHEAAQRVATAATSSPCLAALLEFHPLPKRQPLCYLHCSDGPIMLAIEDGALVVDAPDTVQVGVRPDLEAADRQHCVRGPWWRPTIDAGRFDLLSTEGREHHYRVEFKSNQSLSRGDVEAIFCRGVVSLHEARGEHAPANPDALVEFQKPS